MKKPSLLIYDNKLLYLYTDQNVQTGGIAVEWSHWIKGFTEIGIRVGLLTIFGVKEHISKEVNFEIVETFDQSKGIRYFRYIYYRLPRLYSVIKKFNPDIITQAGVKREIVLLAIISKILRKTFIHRVASDADVDERIKDKLSRIEYLAVKLGIRLSEYIYCQNDYQYKTLKARYPLKKIQLLKNPHKVGQLKSDSIDSKREYIAWVGSFSRVKNLPALLDVIRKCSSINFKIAGKEYDSTDIQTAETLNMLKECKNVEFVGYLQNDKVYEFFKGAYALLNTSLLEGFSNTFLESLSMGTPIITTKNVDPDNFISKYNLGLIANSFEDLSIKVEELFNFSEDQYKELSVRCREYVSENHNCVDLAKNFIKIVAS